MNDVQKATATRLEKLLIAEVSGVDFPASQLDGWLVMKARGEAAAASALNDIGRPLAEPSIPGLSLPWRNANNANPTNKHVRLDLDLLN